MTIDRTKGSARVIAQVAAGLEGMLARRDQSLSAFDRELLSDYAGALRNEADNISQLAASLSFAADSVKTSVRVLR